MRRTTGVPIMIVGEDEPPEEPRGNGPLRVISIKVDPLLLKRIDEAAKECGMNRSEFIRMAVEMLLSELMSTAEKKEGE